MQLTLYRTLCIHTALLVAIGGCWLAHRRPSAATAPVKHVRMPTLPELLEIERLGAELRSLSFYRDPVNLDKRYRELLDLQLRYMPPEHPEVVTNRTALAASLERRGKYAEAAVQYGVLLKVYQRVMGADAPETLEEQRKISEMLRLAKESEEVPKREEAAFRQLYQENSTSRGKEDPHMLWIQSSLVDQLMAQSKWREAEVELRAMLEIQRKIKKSNLADSMLKLALCLEAQRKLPESLAYVQEIEGLKPEVQNEDPDLAESVAKLRSRINMKQKKRGKK